ncbi:Hypothetical protein D9617_4g004580 [Elsinoe fawcettii]|nr:Hypothetical protein D9617_4g004580 [Elsinoe fawcettii]
MKVTLLAGLVACLAVSVSAASEGGDQGFTAKDTGDSKGGNTGDTTNKSGDNKANAEGGGDIKSGDQTANTKGGNVKGGDTEVQTAIQGSVASMGPNSGTVGNSIGGGTVQGGDTVGATQQQKTEGTTQGGVNNQKSGDAVAKGGDSTGGPTGNTPVSSTSSGAGGAGGGNPSLSVPVSTPFSGGVFRRSGLPQVLYVRQTQAESISIDEIKQAITANQQLPSGLEAAWASSPLASQWTPPSNRKPVDPKLESQDVTEAVGIVQSGQLPPDVTSAMEAAGWKKTTKAKRSMRFVA